MYLIRTKSNLFKKLDFKYNDYFLLENSNKSFYTISYKLNKSLSISKNLPIIKNKLSHLNRKNKTIVLFFEDNLNHIFKNIIKKLEKKYVVKISSVYPDYLIYNVFGCNHLKLIYNNSIKIAIYTENQIPDFSIADYAISQHHIQYYDRYFKFPIFLNILNGIKSIFEYTRLKNILNKKTKFCAAMISNYKSSNNFRLKFIEELNKYKKVDMGGKYNNNVGNITNKIEFFSKYKFTIAMENTEADGYVSEKIIDSFLSGSIII